MPPGRRASPTTAGRTRVLHAEGPLLDLGLGSVVAADGREPGAEAGRVVDAIGEAQLVGSVTPRVRGRDALHQGHRDLRAEPRAEAQGEVAVVPASLGEVENAQLGIDFPEVRDRRDEAGLEHLHADDVLDAGSHRVPREALRVRHDDAVGRGAEDASQGEDLGRGAAAACRGVGLVGDEDGVRRDDVAIHAPLLLGAGDEGSP